MREGQSTTARVAATRHKGGSLVKRLVTKLKMWHGERHFHFRKGTSDRRIFHEVVTHDEYRLPGAFHPEDIIIDVGMHIGSFSYAALKRGAGHVYGFEADRANYELAVRNLRSFGNRAHLYHRAVWRSDRTGDVLYSSRYLGKNTGSVNVYWDTSGDKLEVMALDDVIRQATGNGQTRIRCLRLTAKGPSIPFSSRPDCWIGWTASMGNSMT